MKSKNAIVGAIFTLFASQFNVLRCNQKWNRNMKSYLSGLILIVIFSCAPTDYEWHYQREPTRHNYTDDLEYCRAFAAKQYQPGIPTGSPYLEDGQVYPDSSNQNLIFKDQASQDKKVWHPDRDPDQLTNLNRQPVHAVPKRYTGYPGYLDYYPSYLDDILGKCMRDRGWVFRTRQNDPFDE